MESIKAYIGRTLRIFISYSSIDKELAGLFKFKLDSYGFETFLAHEDIEFGHEWEERIIQELSSCDIFIPLLSNNFKESEWAPQENGIAFQLKKKILPMKINMNPFGFIRGIQALKIDKTNVSDACKEIISNLKNEKDKRYSDGIKDTLIRGFVDSWSYEDANMKAKELKNYKEFSQDQIREIIRGALLNSQIMGGFVSGPFVLECYKKNKHRMDRTIIDAAKEIFEE